MLFIHFLHFHHHKRTPIYFSVAVNPSQVGFYNSINPLVKRVPPHIPRPPSARWRPVNMRGHPFYYRNNHVVSWVPPHIHRPQIFRCLRPGPHLFPCSSKHWTTVFCIGCSSLFSKHFYLCFLTSFSVLKMLWKVLHLMQLFVCFFHFSKSVKYSQQFCKASYGAYGKC